MHELQFCLLNASVYIIAIIIGGVALHSSNGKTTIASVNTFAIGRVRSSGVWSRSRLVNQTPPIGLGLDTRCQAWFGLK